MAINREIFAALGGSIGIRRTKVDYGLFLIENDDCQCMLKA